MGEVRQLFEYNQFARTPEAKAEYLEYVAKQIREGKLNIKIGCIVFIDGSTDQADYLPFGEEVDFKGLVGMLEYAKVKIITD